jgi:hypothetical protein
MMGLLNDAPLGIRQCRINTTVATATTISSSAKASDGIANGTVDTVFKVVDNIAAHLGFFLLVCHHTRIVGLC